ncbi:MAG: hypothetical protein BAJALOKI3v1_330009 [Promethearchaeota archaeon]|jgi:DNA-binding Lrp family transcriptional regulator|nr:MAG: hypothetical protein BAJALOKI3v1_330009 [Candidatus Lokiarchaeota archaeon]
MINDEEKIDEIDKQIIEIIQKEPTITHTDIAKRVERSQPTIGMRINRLEELGILQFQAGLNLKVADMFYARAEINTDHPEDLLEQIDKCHFMLNAFRLSGTTNISVLLANSRISFLDKLVNFKFRDNPLVKEVQMNIITEVVEDFVLPIDLNFDECDCELRNECVNSWNIAKSEK